MSMGNKGWSKIPPCENCKKLEAEIKTLKAKSRCYGKCSKGHITTYTFGTKPRCLYCNKEITEIAIELEYAKLQTKNKRLTIMIEEYRTDIKRRIEQILKGES